MVSNVRAATALYQNRTLLSIRVTNHHIHFDNCIKTEYVWLLSIKPTLL